MTRTHSWLPLLAVALTCLSAPPSAKADIYSFSFQGSGLAADWITPITGVVSGRVDLHGSGPATHVWIDSFPALGTLPENDATKWSAIVRNSFTFDSRGALTGAEFEAMNFQGWAAQLNLNYPELNDPTHPGGANYLQVGENWVEGPNGLASTHLGGVARAAAVPEPASFLLLGSIVTVFAVARRKLR